MIEPPLKTRYLAALAIIAVLVSAALPLSAGPHVSIQGIEAGSEHPSVKVRLSVNLPRDAASATLTEENFQVFEDGFLASRLKLGHGGGGQDYLCLVFSFDSSKSIGKTLMSRMKKSAREIIAGTVPGDKIALYRFNDSVILLSDFTSPRSELLKNLEGIQRHGTRTLLYNAIYDSIDRLKKEPANRKAVIVFTDGRDEGSSFTAEDVIRASRAAGIPVHFVCPAAVCASRPLDRIARLSGGRLILSEAGGCASGILGSVPHTPGKDLVLQYTSGLQPDDKVHQLEVRLRHPAVSDRDTQSFRLERTSSDIRIPNITEIMLISLILVLIILLAVVIVIIIRNGGRILAQAPGGTRPEPSYSFSIDDLERRTALPAPPTLTPEDPEYAYSKAWLLEKDGPESGQKFPIFWEELTLGRDEGNTIVVKDQAVSLKHAKIRRIRDTYLLYDLVSENGTLLNGKKLLRPKALYDWDEIRLGRTVFIFRGTKFSE
jgi:hypothetical protein